MNINAALIEAGLKDGEQLVELDPVLFTFNSSADPKDGFTDLVEFDNRANLRFGLGLSETNLPVLNCRHDNLEVIKLILNNNVVFGFKPILLLGYPDSNLDPEFQNLFWASEHLSYDSLLEGFKLDSLLNKKSLDDLTVYEKEKASYTKADGTVKKYNPEVAGESEDDSVEEESDHF